MRSWWDYPGVLKWSGLMIEDKVISRLHKAGCWDLNSCRVALHDEGWTCVEFTGHGSSLNWISATASSTCRIKVNLRRMGTSFFPVNIASSTSNLLWPKSYTKKRTVGYIILASCPWGPVTANGVDLLTEIYVIYMERRTSHRAIARCLEFESFYWSHSFYHVWHNPSQAFTAKHMSYPQLTTTVLFRDSSLP